MKTARGLCGAVLAAAVLLIPSASQAQYQIKWYSINSGGGPVQGGSFKLNFSVGQSVAGYVTSAGFQHWIGFWAGETALAQIIGQIKTLPDGTPVMINGLVATSGAADYVGFLYVEDYNRYMGIRVAATPAQMAAITRGLLINVSGVLGTTPSGERQLTNPFFYPVGGSQAATTVAMRNQWLAGQNLGVPPAGQFGATGGVGTNNVGLLVKTSGAVTAMDGVYAILNDGSDVPLRVDLTEVPVLNRPAIGSDITVVGAASLTLSGPDRIRTVIARDAADITVH